MTITCVRKRLQAFENKVTRLALNKRLTGEVQRNCDISAGLERLQELWHDAHRFKEKAEAMEDDRTVLAAIGELRRIVELSAKLTVQLEERNQMNVLHVELSRETGERIAETYLSRHRSMERTK